MDEVKAGSKYYRKGKWKGFSMDGWRSTSFSGEIILRREAEGIQHGGLEEDWIRAGDGRE